MSSDYGSEASVGSDDPHDPETSLKSLARIMEDFEKAPEPNWLADIRFGHLVVPSCLSAEDMTTGSILSAIRARIDCPVIFVLSRHKQRICSTEMLDLPVLPKHNETTLEYAWFSSILEENRAGEGPGNWKPMESVDEWERNLMLPKQVFVVFSLDPYMSADCALALTGLVQWACDISETQSASIRVLTTSNLFGNNLLSELVSIRSSYPVAHYELPILRYVSAVPEYAVDNSEGDAMYNSIANRVLARDEDDANAILFVPPLTRTDIFPSITQPLTHNALLLKHMNDTGPLMKWRLTLQSQQTLQDNPATVIEIVIGRRCMRHIFDKDIKQVVYTETALTQTEFNDIQWWAYQPNVHPDNKIVYLGSDGFHASEGAAVYRPLHVENDQAGGFIAGVYAMSHWGIQVDRVLEAFVKSPGVASEMKERLQRVGIIHPVTPKLCLGDAQESVFKAVLHLVRYDHRIAHFIALKSSNAEVRRLKVQVAVLMVLATDWPLESLDNETFRIRGWGVFDYVTRWGDLWQHLGLWKYISTSCQDFETIEVSDTFSVSGRDGNTVVRAQGAFIFRQLTTALETTLNGMTEYPDVHLPPHRIRDEVGDLDIHQMTQLLRHLACAYNYQITKSRLAHDDEGEAYVKHVLVSSNTPLELRGRLSPLPLGTFMELEQSGFVYGVCTQLRLEGETLVGDQWTFIPQSLAAEWCKGSRREF
ncbi:hypothetical protein FNAPI_11525 [Fusarium napiforme]|uniref:Uncharacterized protein n=1 Tax=Fusarium napiforme TaxID=42672 RepID=A0A8H5IJA0_9HYPO|nr:hypothetical protein FNAPI_11525 [Fusarium napiforme]